MRPELLNFMSYKPLPLKAPRDPNTPSSVLVLRKIAPEENILCQVGSGECSELAVEAHDAGHGQEFYVCAKHVPEVHAFSKLVAEMTPAQMQKLQGLIQEEESKP